MTYGLRPVVVPWDTTAQGLKVVDLLVSLSNVLNNGHSVFLTNKIVEPFTQTVSSILLLLDRFQMVYTVRLFAEGGGDPSPSY